MFEAISLLGLSAIIFASPLPFEGQSMLAQKSLNLTNRYPNNWVNEVYKHNIILTLKYLKDEINIDSQSFEVKFSLKPGEVFAFQNDVLPEFEGKVVKTTKATFNWGQGFRGSGRVIGDGVCHLASFINMTAQEAGLTLLAPVNHNFAPIPDIPYEFGTSIFYLPGKTNANARQNLYIVNNLEEEVTFNFKVEKEKITLSIYK